MSVYSDALLLIDALERHDPDALEDRIEELTEFESGHAFHTQSGAEP